MRLITRCLMQRAWPAEVQQASRHQAPRYKPASCTGVCRYVNTLKERVLKGDNTAGWEKSLGTEGTQHCGLMAGHKRRQGLCSSCAMCNAGEIISQTDLDNLVRMLQAC